MQEIRRAKCWELLNMEVENYRESNIKIIKLT